MEDFELEYTEDEIKDMLHSAAEYLFPNEVDKRMMYLVEHYKSFFSNKKYD